MKDELTDEEFLFNFKTKKGRRNKNDYKRAIECLNRITREKDKFIPFQSHPFSKIKKIRFQGVILELYTSRTLAHLCLVDIQKVQCWTTAGILPPPVITTAFHKVYEKALFCGRYRNYTAFELLGYAQAYREAQTQHNYFTAKLIKEPFKRVHELASRFARENPAALNLVLNWSEHYAEYRDFRRRLWLFKIGQLSRKLGTMKKLIYRMDEWTE